MGIMWRKKKKKRKILIEGWGEKPGEIRYILFGYVPVALHRDKDRSIHLQAKEISYFYTYIFFVCTEGIYFTTTFIH